MKFKIVTLGCRVNRYESEDMRENLVRSGFIPCDQPDSPVDVVIINSCTVTGTSDRKVVHTINRAVRENPGGVIVLTGCLPQAFPDKASSLPAADVILGNSNRHQLVPSILEFMETRNRVVRIQPHQTGDRFALSAIRTFEGRTRAYLKVQDGCNRFCSYCIIPYARGRGRSKPLENVRQEAEELSVQGFGEVVMTGINLSTYGLDLVPSLTLSDAVEAVATIAGVKRLRLSSLEPDTITDDEIVRWSSLPKFCPHFHLSLQSGCDATLKRMNRHYTAEEYFQLIEKLRQSFPECAFTTDIMVGFPSETDEDFEQSVDFVRRVGFAKLHVFAYSPREGTHATVMPNQIPKAVKDKRCRRMIEVGRELQQEFFAKQLGKTTEVLIETEVEPNAYSGYSLNFQPVQVISDKDLCGKLVHVKVTGFTDDTCIGEIIFD